MTQRALVVGAETQGLTGCVDDCKRIVAWLEKAGFAADDIELVVNDAATRAGILAGYQRLVDKSSEGDVALVFYSGHGHYAVSGRENDPRIFQGIVPFDYKQSSDTDYRGISSIELSIFMRRLTQKTKNATVILDCCHSSQMSRDGAARDAIARALPHPLRLGLDDHLAAIDKLYPGERAQLAPEGNPDAVRLVACGRTESAYEYTNNHGQRTGAMTEALIEILDELEGAPISWSALGQAIRERVLRSFPSQRPDVEGPVRRRLFSIERDDELGGFAVVATPKGGVQIRGGRLHGIHPGDVYSVMPLGSTKFDRKTAFALLTIPKPGATTSDATVEWLNGHTAVAKDAIALPHQLTAPKRAVTVIASGEARAEIEQAIVATRTLRVAEAGDTDRPIATMRLQGTDLTIEDDKGRLFPPATFPGELRQMVGNLRGLGVAQALRELEGEFGITEARHVDIELGLVENGAPRAIAQTGVPIALGDRPYVRVRNTAQQTLYIHIFNVGVRGKVTLLTGFAAAGIQLAKNDEYILGTDEASGALEGLQLTWPDGLPRASFPRIDELFVIATTARVNLSALETQQFVSATRGVGPQLQDLFAQVQDGLTRDIGGAPKLDTFLVKRLWWQLYPRDGQIGEMSFEIDENPRLQAGTRSARAWFDAAPAASKLNIAIRLDECRIENNHAWFATDVRVDALVCTRSADPNNAYRVTTQPFSRIKDGDYLPLENMLLFQGEVRDFVDICVWVSRDRRQGADLTDLIASEASSSEFKDAATALLVTAGIVAAPWVAAVGASAVIARSVYRVVQQASGASIGLYRTSFLANETFGIGTRAYRAQDVTFKLIIEATP